MGSFCSKGSAVDKSPSDVTINVGDRIRDSENLLSFSPLIAYGNLKSLQVGDVSENASIGQSFSFSEGTEPTFRSSKNGASASRKPVLSRVLSQKFISAKSKATAGAKSGTHKVSEVSLLLERASTVGIGMAVDVLDTLGSSMANLNINSRFSSGVASKGNKISILAFEVANTIVKGANLMHSLSEENIKHLKEVVLPSHAVQCIVSTDKKELLSIAAVDKREELKIFSGEVVRFGNRCKDPQWHNLDRYFAKLGSEVTPRQQLKNQAAGVMQQLLTLVQFTAELYHELHAFDKFDQDYQRKLLEDENSEDLQFLRQELKSQGKRVKSLKKKSLWSRNLEEVMDKLVDLVHFMHFEIQEAFGNADSLNYVEGPVDSHQRLGPAGLALHYANIINKIDTLVSRAGSVPPNLRDSLYQNLPPTMKSAVRSKLQAFQLNKEMTASQIKAEMEKTLQWLVPIANNTTKAHHGFGWVGEWANAGAEVGHLPTNHTITLRVETLYHADKTCTDDFLLDLIVWLHHYIVHSRREKNIICSSLPSGVLFHKCSSAVLMPESKSIHITPSTSGLTLEELEMLRQVEQWPKRPSRVSKSQDFDAGRAKMFKICRLSKSSSSTPISMSKIELRKMSMPVIDFDINRIKALDVIDRVDSLRKF